MSRKPKRSFITDAFIHRIANDGYLARAADRIQHKQHKEIERLPRLTTWSLICEEIVDTEYDQDYYERVVNELYCRGISDAELREMRIFAWKTAGWLNFEMMQWDWVSLDENDILRAILWLRQRREISRQDARSMKNYVARHTATVSSDD